MCLRVKGKRRLVVAGIVLIFSSLAIAAGDRYFYESGKIVPGEEWSNVYVYGDSTIVDMNGGLAHEIVSYNASTVNITAGQAYTIDAQDFSKINISGGNINWLSAHINGTITFSGTAESISVSALDSGKVIMAGGQTDYLHIGYNSSINIYSGIVSDSLNAWDSAIVNIYGHDFTYDPYGGKYERGQFRGIYLNGVPFTLDLSDFQTYSHIHLLPEPASLLMFGFGAFALRRKK